MKNAARFLVLSGLTGALALVSSCGGAAGGAGGMYVQSCTLGCTNGIGGAQVSCGIVNTFQNRDIAVVFSEPILLPTLLANNAFQVIDTVTGAVPPGTRLVDPGNPNRAIFRPRLAFDSQGNPLYGFGDGQTYQIRVPGTKQGDNGPFVESMGGQANTSRMLCTIITDQGLVDPVPGGPVVSIFVNVAGQASPVNLDTAGNVVDVLTGSTITFVFNDLMNIGTVVQPSTGQAPFITVKVDPDGSLATVNDQVPVGGSYTFSINQSNLTTTAIFTPSGGFPSAGSGATPRIIVVDVPANVKDLAGNSVSNVGKRTFVPQVVNFGVVTIPAGGEQFVDQTRMDPLRSGADWGAPVAGRLNPGLGGGSGRLGDLVLQGGAPRTLYTSPLKATTKILFTDNVKISDAAEMVFNNSAHVYFKNVVADPLTQVKLEQHLSDTLSELQRYLVNNPNGDPEIAKCTYSLEGGTGTAGANTFVITYATNGTAGDSFIVTAYPEFRYAMFASDWSTVPPGSVPPAADTSPPTNFAASASGYKRCTLDDATAGQLLSDDPLITAALPVDKSQFLTNLAAGAPIPDVLVTDGVFTFASIDLSANAVLNVVGDNPLRLFSRGRFLMADTAVINLPGGSVGTHGSDAPYGQVGAIGGPGAGRGGQGADRPDNTGQANLLALANGPPASAPIINRGITNLGAVTQGRDGEGVGGTVGFGGATDLGSGIGGVQWPTLLPTDTTVFGDMDTNATCDSQQLGGSGSGGAFATDGGAGTALSSAALGILLTPNVPGNTPGGSSASVGLEPTVTPGPKRALTPSLGYLRGGSGGGGAGAGIFGTGTTGTAGVCFVGKTIDVYRSHSGAGGGGGGGAIQIVAGRSAELDGRIDTKGGNGGGVHSTTVVYGLHAQPGGGGSGGAILIQSKTVDITPLPNRLIVSGGFGGSGPSFTGQSSLGGSGGVGLVRVEDTTALDPTVVAISVTPTDPFDLSSSQWLSVGAWSTQSAAIEGLSGAQSCWMKVPGSYFSLTFDSDAPGVPGWDMNVFLDQGAAGINQVSYRDSTVFGGNSPEVHWGSLIDDGTLGGGQSGAPIIVRFQGAKSIAVIADPCNANTVTEIQGITPWVLHPDELNSLTPAPDIIRFQIVFDRSHPDFPLIFGVTDVHVHARPD